jgi:hypothetical protein
MIVCENCGFIAQHALQPLGVWPHTADESSHAAFAPAKVSRA